MRAALLLVLLLACAGVRADADAAVEFSTGFAKPLRADVALMRTLKPSTVQASDHGARGTWHGVQFMELLRAAGAPVDAQLRGPNLSKYVLVTAADGYRVVFALGELDPAFGNHALTLAWERDGAPLSDEEGPFRIVAPGENKQGRWIRRVVKVELLDAPGTPAAPHAH